MVRWSMGRDVISTSIMLVECSKGVIHDGRVKSRGMRNAKQRRIDRGQGHRSRNAKIGAVCRVACCPAEMHRGHGRSKSEAVAIGLLELGIRWQWKHGVAHVFDAIVKRSCQLVAVIRGIRKHRQSWLRNMVSQILRRARVDQEERGVDGQANGAGRCWRPGSARSRIAMLGSCVPRDESGGMSQVREIHLSQSEGGEWRL